MNDENKKKQADKSRWRSIFIGLKHRIQTYKLQIFHLVFILLFTSIICCGCCNLSNDIPDKGKWIVVEDEMDKPRSPATANLLPDGNVLIMGGKNISADTAEIFDPNQMKIIKSIPLNDKRFSGYSTTSLQNGDVYIAGGYVNNNKQYPLMQKLTSTTKIFDSKTYTFRETEPLKYASDRHRIYLLKNGHVLIMHNSKTHFFEELNKRENMKFEIYNPEKDEYYETKNGIHRTSIGPQHMFLDNGNILFSCYGAFPNSKDKTFASMCLYNFEKNKFEPYENIPTEQLFIQLDGENYLAIRPEETYSRGYVYNIKTKEKTPVKNKINRTWRPGIRPQMILLENGNVLILGIILINSSDEYETSGKNHKTAKYSAYIFNREKNIFYEISAPPYPVYDAGIVKLTNGDILIAGGKISYNKISNKIQIYKYKH